MEFGAGRYLARDALLLTERLPMMIWPRWVWTRISPSALAELLACLEQSLSVPAGIYEIGGADGTTYEDMIGEYDRLRGLRRRRSLDIPSLNRTSRRTGSTW